MTDRRTDRRTPGDSKDRDFASHRAVKTVYFLRHSAKVDVQVVHTGASNYNVSIVASLIYHSLHVYARPNA